MITDNRTERPVGEVREIELHLTREEMEAVIRAAARLGMTAPQLMAAALMADATGCRVCLVPTVTPAA